MEKTDSYNQMIQTLLNYTEDFLFVVNRERHILFATPNCYEKSGYSPEELRNRDSFFMVHPDDRENLIKRHENLIETGKKNSSEYRMIHKNGEVRYVECKTTPLPDTEEYLQVVCTRDINDRKLMEKELDRQKKRYEVLQNSLKNFSSDLSQVMKLSDLKERLLREVETILPGSNPTLFIYNPDDYNGIPVELLQEMTCLEVGKSKAALDKVFVKIGEQQNNYYILSLFESAIREKMDSIWLETLAHYTVMVFKNLNVIENLIFQLESTVQNNETPQWVLRLLFNLQEQQRMTLSSDLHDTVLQDQIDLYRRLESLINKVELSKESKLQLREVEQGLLDIIHKIRVTCNELRPPLLRELGLERALENLFEHVQITSTYKIVFSSENVSLTALSEETTIGIYRIVQELLSNAEKYSKASLLHFNLTCKDGIIQMTYTDDGVGFDTVKLNPSLSSMGLTSMSQRAQSLEGEIEFISKPGSGLIAILKLPVNKEGSLI
ncbi:PAS domain-containing protein [Fredinandcohnia humi]